MTKRLTKSQTIKFYFPGIIISIIFSSFLFLDFITPLQNNILLFDSTWFNGLMVLSGVTLILVRKRQLRYKEFRVNCTEENFEQALLQIAKVNDWEIKSREKDEIVVLQRLYFSVYILITIIKKDSTILINCIQNPDHISFEATLGWRRKNIESFINNLSYEIDKTYYFKNRISIWYLIIRIMVVIGYLSSLMFIGLSIFFVLEDQVVLGIIIGFFGIYILGQGVYKLFKKPNR